MKHIYLFVLCLFVGISPLMAQNNNYNNNKFKQLKEELPTPNVYRTAAGAPGHQYYQQQADYEMDIRLDDENQRVYGEHTITYTNNSPDVLDYVWIQLDQNVRAQNALSSQTRTSSMDETMSFRRLKRMHNDFDGGFKIDYVRDENEEDYDYTINHTMMRVEPKTALKSGDQMVIKMKWWYNINDRMQIGGRSGYEYFEENDNYLYTIAQFFPRMAVYNDVEGWQNKQFLGRGEFALPFGNYKVSLTVPGDHLVAATGTLSNAEEILPKEKRDLLEKAKSSDEPVIIYSEKEAKKREKKKSKDTKTWVFEAENVRDFAFASSRKFIWDAMGVQSGDNTVMAMSMYPKEGNPLWEKFSTEAVAHTVEVYSSYTFDYPYPVAWSINAASIGMEYPMICFNFGRTEKDGTYSERTKYGVIGVIIHEVGHFYFPMIVNSDERQWTWMDEGLNTFLQYRAEQEWERNFPSRRGPAANMVDYMKGDKNYISPIMTNSESIYQFGNNAYGKPATALNILRESIMGPEQFDYAFKKYAQRWMFKHPTPADFFRTMEDASAVDLDWFWRGWFYTNNHADQKLADVKWFQPSTGNPDVEKDIARKQDTAEPVGISSIRDDIQKRISETRAEAKPELVDFYTTHDEFDVDAIDKAEYKKYKKGLTKEELDLIAQDLNYYEVTVENVGGLVMPVILRFEYEDGTSDVKRIPAEIWKLNDQSISKVFYSSKKLKQVELDPFLEIADTDRENNYWPERNVPTRFELFKRGDRDRENKMQRDERARDM